jgi:hypothetical protein
MLQFATVSSKFNFVKLFSLILLPFYCALLNDIVEKRIIRKKLERSRNKRKNLNLKRDPTLLRFILQFTHFDVVLSLLLAPSIVFCAKKSEKVKEKNILTKCGNLLLLLNCN